MVSNENGTHLCKKEMEFTITTWHFRQDESSNIWCFNVLISVACTGVAIWANAKRNISSVYAAIPTASSGLVLAFLGCSHLAFSVQFCRTNRFLCGCFKYFWNSHPYLGKIPNLTHILQRGRNHQLDFLWLQPAKLTVDEAYVPFHLSRASSAGFVREWFLPNRDR